MQTNISITSRFDEIRLLGFRVPGLGLGSVLPVVPHKLKNLTLRSVSTFFVSPPRGILDSTLHRHPTHILSPNLCHRMCPYQGIGTEKSLKLTFIHQDSRLDIFYPVNLCQTSSIIVVSRIPLYTGTPHILSLPTTVIACVWVKE